MRLRKIKEAQSALAQDSMYVIHQPTEWKGRWHQIFQNTHPLHLEIGMGKGKFLLELARKHPDINFIGMEKYDSVLYKALQKASSDQLANLKLLWFDAADIDTIFDHNELDCIYLNFSDPWPKTKQKKRRLTYPTYLEKYRLVRNINSTIRFKTDNFAFFMDSMMSFVETNHRIDSIVLDLHSHPEIDNVETEFESKFKAQGKWIYQIVCH